MARVVCKFGQARRVLALALKLRLSGGLGLLANITTLATEQHVAEIRQETGPVGK